jgi:hypothetical protein
MISFKEFYDKSETSWRKECQLVSFQGSGSGGQKRNRVYSGVRFVHSSGSQGESCDHREVKRNEKEALIRLKLNIAYEQFKDCNIESGDYFKQFTGKISINHELYPSFVLYSLHYLNFYKGFPTEVSASLGMSNSKLIRQWSKDKRLFTQINKIRLSYELKALKST